MEAAYPAAGLPARPLRCVRPVHRSVTMPAFIARLIRRTPLMGRIFEVRKHTMFARWNRMAKQFARIAKDITMAVKAGGPTRSRTPPCGASSRTPAR